MMKVAVNCEFTSEELEKLLVNSMLKALTRVGMMIEPSTIMTLLQTLGASMAGSPGGPAMPFGSPGCPRAGGPFGGPSPFGGFGGPSSSPFQGGPFATGRPQPEKNGAAHVEHCFAIEETRHMERGWGCCKCATYNGADREVCRHCDHRRCHANATPPSPAASPEPAP
jgi:hypothetical protein